MNNKKGTLGDWIGAIVTAVIGIVVVSVIAAILEELL